MRIRVIHETVYEYADPALYLIQALRVSPRSHDGQFVCRWRIDIGADCRLDPDEDAFGNLTHTFSMDGPIERLRIAVEGEIETEDTGGIVRNTVERLPPAFYLRGTDATAPDAALRAVAAEIGAGAAPLDTLHALLGHVHETFEHDGAAHTQTSARAAWAAGRGTSQDAAHIFIALAHAAAIPARYVAGHVLPDDEIVCDRSGHAWAEAHLPGLGWIGFDPVNGLCVTERHVRVSAALDATGASTIRGVRTGGGVETMTASLTVAPARPFVRPLPERRPAHVFAAAHALQQSQAQTS